MESFIKNHDSGKQVSSTGARALIIMLALVSGPKTCEEIKQFVIDCGFADKEYSIDTIRIDINTLRTIGCDIPKATKKNGHRFCLCSHPFRLNITEDEVNALRNVYRLICKSASPQKLLEYHYLFMHLSDMTDDEKMKEQLLGLSILKKVNLKIMHELVCDEKRHNLIKVTYMPPHSEEREYEITIERIGLRSGKLYVYCYNHTIKKRSFLNISRIKSIVSSIFDRNSEFGLDTRIKYKLFSYRDYRLEENEIIIEEHEDYAIIQGRYFNDFIGVQRMLSFGPDCIVCEPQEIKEEVINKLLEMRSVYD